MQKLSVIIAMAMQRYILLTDKDIIENILD